MRYQKMRQEIGNYYFDAQASLDKSKAFAEHCFAILDQKVKEGMTVPQQKVLQYNVIVDECDVTVFPTVPFYFESGVLSSLSDGAHPAKNGKHIQANGWVAQRNAHLFRDKNPELLERRNRQGDACLYLICGAYNDEIQHYNFNHRPILEGGLKGIYERARAEMEKYDGPEEKEFFWSVCEGMLALKRLAEKYAAKAEELLREAGDSTDADRQTGAGDSAEITNLRLIAETAKRVPWEAPKTFCEALCCYAFMRTGLGSLEGVGPNTFGRLDMDLYPFYQHDIGAGILTKEQAYDLICKFLLIWDLHYDHDMKMVKYADHELENTYTLGGVDREGNLVYNELTQMFLQATREECVIFPKITVRYGKTSPKEYMDEINKAVIKGTTTIIHQNDDATIPALVNGGVTLEEARDYLVTGCWGVTVQEEKFDHGSYVNLLKPFEYGIHNLKDQMAYVGIDFETYDRAEDFEEVYRITVENSRKLIEERINIVRQGGSIWPEVDTVPIFSSTLQGCMESGKDHTRQGGKYHDDHLLIFGLPNIVDSLMAIKTLVFDQKKYSLGEFLDVVRNNWEGHEDMRIEAMRCEGWGDGSEAGGALANRFNNDLFAICSGLKGSYGGRVHMGHLTYTEIRFWGEKTLATPDGRKSGDYFSQGLTPSRLKKIPAVTDVIYSLKCLDPKTMAGDNVVNIILPADKIDLDTCEAFLRACSESSLMSLQLNCVTKEQLLDAQKHPEKYPELIVRVCGFSARFTSLSPEWQQEVLTRNYYE